MVKDGFEHISGLVNALVVCDLHVLILDLGGESLVLLSYLFESVFVSFVEVHEHRVVLVLRLTLVPEVYDLVVLNPN